MSGDAAGRLEASGAAARETPSGTASSGTVMPCEAKAHWIEIELLDAEGAPVPNEPYWVRLADRREVTGTLDKKGFARLDGIPPGICVVRFPERDRRDFQPLAFGERVVPAATPAAADPRKKVWLEIELTDEEGVAVPREAYVVRDEFGVEHAGVLNEKGFARLEGFLGAKCMVRFPNVDRSGFTGTVEHRDTRAL